MKTLALNIAILPDENTTNRAIALSQLTAEWTEQYFVLDRSNYVPHLSVYHAIYDQAVKSALTRVVASIVKSTSAFEIHFSAFDYFADYLFLNALMSNKLYELHMNVLDACNPLRTQIIPESINELIKNKQINEQQIALVAKYGHPLTEKFFRPHITLTRLKDIDVMQKTIEKLPKQKITMNVKGLAIVNIGEHGTCNQILETFRLN
jgi:2'-5' RNA ligase